MPALFVFFAVPEASGDSVRPAGRLFLEASGRCQEACRKMAMELAFYVGAGGFRKELGRFFWRRFGLMSVRSLFKVSKFWLFPGTHTQNFKVSKF